MSRLIREENGTAIVEATLLLPFCMIMIIALFYTAIFMCQKANLQANVQNALIYYKNIDTDSFIKADSSMAYGDGENAIEAMGSHFEKPSTALFPYRFLFMKFEEGAFETFFRSMCKYMFFDDGESVKFEPKKTNYIIYKEISVTATQTVKPAINLAMVGAGNEIEIVVTGKTIVSDGDDFIRNIDFAVDIFNQTSLGKKAHELVDKAKEFYDKFKEKFNITSDE